MCRRNCRVTLNARRGRGTTAYDVAARTRDGDVRNFSNSVLVLGGDEGAFRVVHLLRKAEPASLRRPPVTAQQHPFTPAVATESITRRELQVLRLVADGSTIEDVADAFTISIFTARNHIASLERKLGARSRLELVLQGMRAGLI